ncbi:MAG: transposase [Campylobacterota bacterium]|nr:transposase [Campylobacterota bacterium]
MSKQLRTYKYKLYKTKRTKHLHQLIDITGIIYNHCIALHKRYYKLYGKHLNKYQLQKHLTKLKKREKYAYWNMLGSQAIQNITERIDNGYRKFFEYAKGKTRLKASPPSFKKVKQYRSFTFKGSVGYKLKENVISINGYHFKFWLSRAIEGKIKTITVKRDNIGDFYICILLEQEAEPNRAASGKSVGIDFGLKTFLVLSDDMHIEAILHYLNSIKRLRKLSCSLSKKIKGSNNRKKAKRTLAKLHIKIANQRRHVHHRLANHLAAQYDYIFVEDLNMKAMQKLWGRKIGDLGFSEFINVLSCKTNVIKIDRFYPSSKTCSSCGHVLNELDLKTREWDCPVCRAHHSRDLNAAINIHRVGASTLGIDMVRPASQANVA